MRPTTPSNYPFTPPDDEPEVHVPAMRPHSLAFTSKTPIPAPVTSSPSSAPSAPSPTPSTPPVSTVRPFDDGRAALVAELDRLRARADALLLTPELARRLGGERAGETLAAIATIRRAIDESTERITRALGVERVPQTRRRVAG
jgi:hypothetical protein